MKRLAGLKDSDNTTLKEALENLSKTVIKYNIFGKDNAHEWTVFSVLSMAQIKSEGRGKPTMVTFEFPSLVLEMVKNPNMFVRLNLLALRDLKSKHSIALYEFLKDYLNL